MGGLELALSYLTTCAAVMAVVRLFQTHFIQVGRWFSAYLLVLCGELISLKLITPHTNVYAWTYIAFQSLNLIVACGVIREIYRLALDGHVGLAEFGHSMMRWAVGIVVAASGLSISLDSDVLPGQSRIAHRFFTIERTGDLVLLLLLLVIGIYLTWFPVQLRRNIVIYSIGFMAFFCFRSVGLLMANLLPQAQLRSVSNMMLIAETLCLVAWIFGFRRESEDEITTTGHRWDPSQYERLTAQLDSINAVLERHSRG